jgi:hypothetical protein
LSDIAPFRSIGAIAGDLVTKIALGEVERHPVTDRASWLAMRGRDLTASDVASICGCGYRGPLEVWAEKTGKIPPKGDSPILRRGRWLEPAIWAAVQDTNPSWTLRAAKTYLRAPALRFGATPDALAVDPDRKGIVLIQGKVVAQPTFIADWCGGARDNPSPTVPLGYQLQTLSETMLAEAAFGETIHPVLAALVIGSFTAELYMIPVERHFGAEERILGAVKQFWEMTDAGQQPAADPDKDHDAVRKLYAVDDGSTVDLTGDNSIPSLMDERKRLGEVENAAKARRDVISTEIMAKMGNASFAVIAGGRKISCKTTTVKEAVRAGYSFRSIREVKVK